MRPLFPFRAFVLPLQMVNVRTLNTTSPFLTCLDFGVCAPQSASFALATTHSLDVLLNAAHTAVHHNRVWVPPHIVILSMSSEATCLQGNADINVATAFFKGENRRFLCTSIVVASNVVKNPA